MAYKIIEDNVIQKNDGVQFIAGDMSNPSYYEFIESIALGENTVEGPDVISEGYSKLREDLYPPLVEQLDMQYWDAQNNTTTWADAIQAIKDANPKSVERTVTVGPVPAWVQEEVDTFLHNKQLSDYSDAIKRLSKFIVSEGLDEVKQNVVLFTEDVLNELGEATYDEQGNKITTDITEEVVVTHAVSAEPLNITNETYNVATGETTVETIENPAVTQDNAERAEAQAVVDATPQSVIDTYNE